VIERPMADLDSFETALLAQLQEEVRKTLNTAPVEHTASPPQLHTRHRKRWLAAAATVGVALVIAWQVPGLGPTPAYAVTGRNNGEVLVRVNRLEGADGLERALSEHGIAADITYLPAGKECSPGRYTDVSPRGLVLGVAVDWFEVTIPPGAVGKGDTFVLSAAVAPVHDGFQATTDFAIAHGTVKPCQIINSP
jgi:hypothetical protein